jgi:hypothetical protein
MNKKIGLIACCKSKLKGKYKAKDIYVSNLFKKSKKYCRLYLDDYFILSAKYYLLNKENIIQYYDLTLNNMTKQQILDWSNIIKNKLQIFKEDKLFILAGKLYYKYWINCFNNVNIVFNGKRGIGYILQFLKKEIIRCEQKNKFFS